MGQLFPKHEEKIHLFHYEDILPLILRQGLPAKLRIWKRKQPWRISTIQKQERRGDTSPDFWSETLGKDAQGNEIGHPLLGYQPPLGNQGEGERQNLAL